MRTWQESELGSVLAATGYLPAGRGGGAMVDATLRLSR
ncbi:hypothetical protein BX264_0168 [Streptomyces sp. 2333.5]|nr:hypothetical protein BX264_0168 [Streptomyces sp. 2333.5]SEB63586.1 hypothetical protein SAMN05428943_0166 [Streptomyces sp. 2314.4]SEC48005.1 hypothetical protein SAMN05428942_0167 [Streptomyces sp. 2112.2]SOE16093.1 hypothetical protein SAMN06272775_6978 [Streptomyces sp. 2323.1]